MPDALRRPTSRDRAPAATAHVLSDVRGQSGVDGVADAGWQSWDGKGWAYRWAAESVGEPKPSQPRLAPLQFPVGEGPAADGDVVLGNDVWAVVQSECRRDRARNPLQSRPSSVGQGDVFGEVRSRGTDGRRYVGAEFSLGVMGAAVARVGGRTARRDLTTRGR